MGEVVSTNTEMGCLSTSWFPDDCSNFFLECEGSTFDKYRDGVGWLASAGCHMNALASFVWDLEILKGMDGMFT